MNHERNTFLFCLCLQIVLWCKFLKYNTKFRQTTNVNFCRGLTIFICEWCTWRPWVNFINVLRVCFLYKILVPKITMLYATKEKLLNLLSYEKCTHKTLMKLTPSVNFINILSVLFCAKFWCQKSQSWKKLLNFISHEKCAHKTLMKLTTSCISIRI